MIKVGIISDTHGLLREKIIESFQGCQYIFHGGDIGKQEILSKLALIAPVIVVKGNNDKEEWAKELPIETLNTVGNKSIYMIHDLKQSKKIFENSSIDIVISGHSHIYKEEQKDSILYLNPGGGGPKRFGRPATAMLLMIEEDEIRTEKITIT